MINVNVCAYSVDISLISGQVIPTTSDTDKRSALFSCLLVWCGYL